MEQQKLTIIEDTMPSEDAFGPHTRLAELLGRHIAETQRSGAIGLQGSWGSGKSAVIHFLGKRLPSIDKEYSRKTHLFVFDAWAHEGDELRRSFLDELNQSIHLDENTRASSQESIWQVKETVTTETSHTLTMGALGLALAFAAMTSALAVLELEQEGIVDLSDATTSILATVVASPFTAIIVALLVACIKWLRPSEPRSLPKILQEEVNLIDAGTSGERVSHTTRTAESSFQEFEKKLRDMIHSVSENLDNFIVVVDNIDRLEPAKARLFWSSLAPFFDRALRSQNIGINVWLIVPFSRSHLDQVFEKVDRPDYFSEQSPLPTAKNESETAAGYIEKTFDVIFEVPPPILTDWRKYLEQLLLVPFPQLEKDSAELFAITKVFDLNNSTKVTPRAVKTFVNNISVVRAQLAEPEEIPLRVIASYVQHSPSFESAMGGSGPSSDTLKAYERPVLNEDQIDLMFAAIYYGVSLARAPQALMREPLLNALREIEAEVLDHYSKSEGFEDVLYDTLLIELPTPNINARDLTSTVETLAGAKTAEFSQRIWQYVAAAYPRAENWLSLAGKLPHTIISINEHLAPPKKEAFLIVAKLSLESYSELTATDVEPLATIAKNWVRAAIYIKKYIDDISIPDDPEFTFEVLAEALEQEVPAVQFPFKPTCSTMPFEELAVSKRSPEVLLGISRIISDNIPQVFENISAASIAQQFDGAPEIEKTHLQGKLILLLAASVLTDDEQAMEHLNDLFQDGTLRHQIAVYSTDQDILSCGLLATIVAAPQLEFNNEIGQSAEGTEALTNVFEDRESHQEILGRLGKLASHMGHAEILYSQASKFSPIREAALGALSEVFDELEGMEISASESTADPQFIVDVDEIFDTEEEFGFVRLLKKTGHESQFIDELMGLGFKLENAYLHFRLVEFAEATNHTDYLDFLIQGLDQTSVEEWESDLVRALDDSDSVASLASEVRSAKTDFKLGHKSRDALTKAAQKIRSNQLDASTLATDSIRSNLDGLDDAQRALCQEEILKEILISSSQNERSAIYSTFQVGRFDEDVVHSDSGEFAALEDNFLRDKDIAGLAWFMELVSDFPRMYPKAPRARKDSIKGRLKELMEGQEINDEVKELAEKTYDLLKLKPKRKIEKKDDT